MHCLNTHTTFGWPQTFSVTTADVTFVLLVNKCRSEEASPGYTATAKLQHNDHWLFWTNVTLPAANRVKLPPDGQCEGGARIPLILFLHPAASNSSHLSGCLASHSVNTVNSQLKNRRRTQSTLYTFMHESTHPSKYNTEASARTSRHKTTSLTSTPTSPSLQQHHPSSNVICEVLTSQGQWGV